MERLSYTVAELQSATGLGRTKIFELLKTRTLHRIKVGRRTLISGESVKALIEGTL